jgi:hypothetical protein
MASRIYSAYFLFNDYYNNITLLDLSHDYSYNKMDNISLSDITEKLRKFRPTSELREQFSYNNAVWLSYSSVLVVSKGET